MENNSPYEDVFGINYNDGDSSMERVPYSYVKSDTDKVHTVLDGETLQSIAYKYYSDSGLWYIIADSNNILDPISDIIDGLELIIPI